jgi:hypothetical protein
MPDRHAMPHPNGSTSPGSGTADPGAPRLEGTGPRVRGDCVRSFPAQLPPGPTQAATHALVTAPTAAAADLGNVTYFCSGSGTVSSSSMAGHVGDTFTITPDPTGGDCP